MPLSAEQKAKLEDEAQRRGIDAAKLIAAAEKELSAGSGSQTTTAPPSTKVETEGKADKGKPAKAEAPAEKPNLFMYLLPFVTVNEVRTIWLELEPIAGGEKIASKWAAEQAGTPATATATEPPSDEP